MAQLRGEELLRFIQSQKRKPKKLRLSAYEILVQSGYERRKESVVNDYYSVKTFSASNFINYYCQALIEKHGIPEKLEHPLGPNPNPKFATEATMPDEMLAAVKGLKMTMSVFKAGYISLKNKRIRFHYNEYRQAVDNAREKIIEEGEKENKYRKLRLEELAKKSLKDELNARSKQYREKGVKGLESTSTTEPSPKAEGLERELLVGEQLVHHCIRLANQGVPETSICIRAGYSTDSIGVFRRAFSKAGKVRFGPLSVMLRDHAKTRKDAPKTHAETGTSRSVDTEITPNTLTKIKTAQAITEEKKLVTVTIKQRERDAAFRDAVLKSHGEQCICCDIAIRELLEAAHIIPVAFSGSDIVANGIPLCPTHHSAFDRNLFAFDPVKKTILLKEGLKAADLGITKNTLEFFVSEEALRIRMKLFLDSNRSQR